MSTTVQISERGGTGIPVVDLGGFHNEDEAERRRTASALRAALESLGFCYLRNHGVPQSTVDALFANSRAFFALPQGVKQALKRTSKGRNVGYQGVGSQALEEMRPGDLKETFQAVKEAVPGGSPNVWPTELPGFREAILALYQAADRACRNLMRAIALSLGLPEAYFEPFYDHADHTLRLLHYPPLQGPPLPGQLRAGAHTDYGAVSILLQGDEGGLEIQKPDGTWLSTPCLPGTAVLNTGDLVERWTNGMFRSSPHRVVNPEGEATKRDRYSAVLFHGPNDDAVISCLEPCQSPEWPAKYPPITTVEHIRARVLASQTQPY